MAEQVGAETFVRVRLGDATSGGNLAAVNSSGQVSVVTGTGASATQVQGTANDGMAEVGNPVQVGGVDGGGLAQALSVDPNGRANVNVVDALPTGANTIGTVNVGTFPDNEPFNLNQLSGTALATPFDADTGAGTQNLQGISLRKAAAGGSVEYGTATDPLRTDPTGTTTQPVSGTVTANQGTANATPWNENIAQINGVTPLMGNGVTGTGSQRVTIASDNTAFTVNVGTFPDNEPFNVAQIAGTAIATGNGVVSAGVQRVAIASDNTAFNVNVGTFPDNEPFNVAQFGGAAVATGTGAGGAGIPRVTLSNDSSLAANQSVNTAQINGVAPTMGNGISGTGVQRVTLASDSTGQVALAAGAAIIGSLAANQSTNVAQINGVAPLMGNGVTGTGSPRVSIATDANVVDTELPAAAALADAVSATPTTPTVGAVHLLMNATTVDRQRAVVNSLDSVGTGIAAAGLVAQFDETSPSAVTENQFAPVRLSSRRALHVETVGAQITLQASQVSAIINGTTTRSTTTGLAGFRDLDILINITGAGVVTGTLQLFLQDSPDGGTTWDDLVASNTFVFGAALITQRFMISGRLATTITQGSAAAIETLVAGTVRNGPWGDRIRVREVITGIGGTPTGVTYTINAIAK